MTPQRAKELLPIITAFAEGSTIQGRFSDDPDDSWDDLYAPDIDRTDMEFRIKPKPVTRPWSKPEDVPGPVCWIRGKHGSGINEVQRLVICVNGDCKTITYAPGSAAHIVTFGELADQWEHSTDRKTWLPCTVTEQA